MSAIPETYNEFADERIQDLKDLREGKISSELPQLTEEEQRDLAIGLGLVAASILAIHFGKKLAERRARLQEQELGRRTTIESVPSIPQNS